MCAMEDMVSALAPRIEAFAGVERLVSVVRAYAVRSALLATWLGILAARCLWVGWRLRCGFGHGRRRDHPHQLTTSPITTAPAPITTQVGLPVMKLPDTITLRPCRIQIEPATAMRTPTSAIRTGRTVEW